MVQRSIYMIIAGAGVYLFKLRLGGHIIDAKLIDVLGEKRGYVAQLILWVGSFIGGQSYFSREKCYDMNFLINPRDPNGEAMIGIIMQHYSHKVDHGKLREIMLEKKEM